MEIELKNATRKFSRTTALDSVSLKTRPGDCIAVTGLPGSGKSSLLRALSGSIGLSSGELLYDGVEFSDQNPEMRRSVLFLGNPPPLVPGDTVLRNISWFLTQYRMEADSKMTEKIGDLLNRFELTQRAESAVENLSETDAENVCLLIVAAIDPPVWILDCSFPVDFGEIVSNAIAKGSTVIYSTQKVDTSRNPATRVCMMNKGEIYADGEPWELQKLAETDFLVQSLI